jgi:C1A family cysteine protease
MLIKRHEIMKMIPKVGGCLVDRPASHKEFSRSKIAYGGSTSKDVDLREFTSPRHEQLQTSTCASQSVIKALEIKRIMKHGRDKHVDLSILDLYYGARDLTEPKMTNVDGGSFISLNCAVLEKYGVCRESTWPFDESKILKRPPIMATREARMNRIKTCFCIKSLTDDRIDDVIYNLHAGNPVVFDTLVGDDWFEYNGKTVLSKETRIKGNHAMTIVGFVDGRFVVENSWGNDFGDDGFAYLDPFVIADENLTHTLWVIADGSEVWYEEGM